MAAPILANPKLSGEDDPEFVQSLAKGLAVIEAFGPQMPAMTLSEVARKVGLSPGSARRMLRTLQRLGYVGSDGQRFTLLPRTLQLGYAYLSSLPLTSVVQPRLTALTQEVDGSPSVSVLDGHDVVYVARATGRGLLRDYMAVGTRYPAHTTSAGKVLLGAMPRAALKRWLDGRTLESLTANTIADHDALLRVLDEARAQGWAINNQETALGHRSIAVAVTVGGRVVAAMGIGCEVARVTIETMVDDFLPRLQREAALLATSLTALESAGGMVLPWA